MSYIFNEPDEFNVSVSDENPSQLILIFEATPFSQWDGERVYSVRKKDWKSIQKQLHRLNIKYGFG